MNEWMSDSLMSEFHEHTNNKIEIGEAKQNKTDRNKRKEKKNVQMPVQNIWLNSFELCGAIRPIKQQQIKQRWNEQFKNINNRTENVKLFDSSLSWLSYDNIKNQEKANKPIEIRRLSCHTKSYNFTQIHIFWLRLNKPFNRNCHTNKQTNKNLFITQNYTLKWYKKWARNAFLHTHTLYLSLSLSEKKDKIKDIYIPPSNVHNCISCKSFRVRQ